MSDSNKLDIYCDLEGSKRMVHVRIDTDRLTEIQQDINWENWKDNEDPEKYFTTAQVLRSELSNILGDIISGYIDKKEAKNIIKRVLKYLENVDCEVE